MFRPSPFFVFLYTVILFRFISDSRYRIRGDRRVHIREASRCQSSTFVYETHVCIVVSDAQVGAPHAEDSIRGDELTVRLLLGEGVSTSMIMYLRASPSPSPPSLPAHRHPSFFRHRVDVITDDARRRSGHRELHCQPPADIHICMHWRRTARNCQRCDHNRRPLCLVFVSRKREAREERFFTFYKYKLCYCRRDT